MPATAGEPAPSRGGAYTYAGSVAWEYSPDLDRDADPGEVVWTWVSFEEDATVGKDRPVAVIGRTQGRRLAALMLSSRDHRGDRGWLSIGRGLWDREGRESWVRTDRVLEVDPAAVRREGAVLAPEAFASIALTMGATTARSTLPRRSGLLARLAARLRRRPA